MPGKWSTASACEQRYDATPKNTFLLLSSFLCVLRVCVSLCVVWWSHREYTRRNDEREWKEEEEKRAKKMKKWETRDARDIQGAKCGHEVQLMSQIRRLPASCSFPSPASQTLYWGKRDVMEAKGTVWFLRLLSFPLSPRNNIHTHTNTETRYAHMLEDEAKTAAGNERGEEVEWRRTNERTNDDERWETHSCVWHASLLSIVSLSVCVCVLEFQGQDYRH